MGRSATASRRIWWWFLRGEIFKVWAEYWRISVESVTIFQSTRSLVHSVEFDGRWNLRLCNFFISSRVWISALSLLARQEVTNFWTSFFVYSVSHRGGQLGTRLSKQFCYFCIEFSTLDLWCMFFSTSVTIGEGYSEHVHNLTSFSEPRCPHRHSIKLAMGWLMSICVTVLGACKTVVVRGGIVLCLRQRLRTGGSAIGLTQ